VSATDADHLGFLLTAAVAHLLGEMVGPGRHGSFQNPTFKQPIAALETGFLGQLVIEGNPEKVTDVTDVWMFARDLSSRDPNWKLVATEAGR
jgi:hypothetical protein